MKKLVLLSIVVVSGFALVQDCGWKMRELEKAIDEFKKCEKLTDNIKKCEKLAQKIEPFAAKHQECINKQYEDLQTKFRSKSK